MFDIMQILNLHRMKRGRIRSYSVRMWENTNQNNSKYWHYLRSAKNSFSVD